MSENIAGTEKTCYHSSTVLSVPLPTVDCVKVNFVDGHEKENQKILEYRSIELGRIRYGWLLWTQAAVQFWHYLLCKENETKPRGRSLDVFSIAPVSMKSDDTLWEYYSVLIWIQFTFRIINFTVQRSEVVWSEHVKENVIPGAEGWKAIIVQ